MNPRSIQFPKENPEKRRARANRTATFLSGLDGAKAWEIIVRPFKRTRSNQQNRYLRGVCAVMIANAAGYDPDETYEYLLGTYFGWKTKAVPKTPNNPRGIDDIPIRTTTTNAEGERDVLNKQDFWDFVEFVQRFGAKHGVMIPDPDPEYATRHERRAA